MPGWINTGTYFKPKGWFMIFAPKNTTLIIWEKIRDVINKKSIPNLLSASRPKDPPVDESPSQLFILNINTDDGKEIKRIAKQIAESFDDMIDDKLIFRLAVKPKETSDTFSRSELVAPPK